MVYIPISQREPTSFQPNLELLLEEKERLLGLRPKAKFDLIDTSVNLSLPSILDVISAPEIPPVFPSKVRLPFAKEAAITIPAAPQTQLIALTIGLPFRILEWIPSAFLSVIQDYREIATLGKVEPLKLPFDARRLGFEEPNAEIESIGVRLNNKFEQLNKENPPQNDLDVWKNAGIASLTTVVPDAFNKLFAAQLLGDIAAVSLKLTKYTPELEWAISKYGMTQQEAATISVRDFQKKFEIIAKQLIKDKNIAGLQELEQSTRIIGQVVYGQGIPKLNKFFQILQNTSRDLLVPINQIGTGFKGAPLVTPFKELPGFRPTAPGPAFGLTIQPLEPVGKGVRITAKEAKDIALNAIPKDFAVVTTKSLQVKIASELIKGGVSERAAETSAEEISPQIIEVVKATKGKEAQVQIAQDTLQNYITKTGFTKTIQPVELPKISKELQPLAEEARKYKSAEAFGKAVSNRIELNIPISKIKYLEDIIAKTKPSFTSKPIRISYDKSVDKFFVIDGEHRVADAFKKGEINIKAVVDFKEPSYPEFLTDFYNQATKEIKPSKRPPTAEAILRKPKPVQITRLEAVLLKERLRAEARGAKRAVSQFKREQRFLDKLQSEIRAEFNKPKGKRRSTISFIRQLGEFPQTTLTEVKKEVGLTKPLREANLKQLDEIVSKLKERLKFKMKKGFRPSPETTEKLKIKPRQTNKPEFNDDFYTKNISIQEQQNINLKAKVQEQLKRSKDLIEVLLTPISTRLKLIDPTLKARLRRFEFNTKNIQKADSEIANRYLEKTKDMSKDDFSMLDLALKNGDVNKIKELTIKYGMEREYNDVKALLNRMYDRSKEVNFDIGYLNNYWPRRIKDSEGFLMQLQGKENWSILEEAIKRKELDLGRYLSQDERAHLINTMIRGYSGGQISLSKTGAMKHRVLDFVSPELNQFYYDSNTALIDYIEKVNEAIEARRFFGKHIQTNNQEGLNTLDDSIGAFTADLLAQGKITPNQETELRGILQARFGAKGTRGIISAYKNLAYIDTLGNIENAMTQIGDLAFTFYKAGIVSGVKATIKAALGKVQITKADIGLAERDIMAEFDEKQGLRKYLDFILKIIGFNRIDRLGAESLIEGAVTNAQRQALRPTDKFIRELHDMFPEKIFGQGIVDTVLNELKSKVITDNVKFYAFNTLMNLSPRVLSEMPEAYLRAGNGRIFYMLKTWTLKMFDVARNEAFETMKTNKLEGLKNLMRLAFYLMLMNATADTIKDFITGRPIKLNDLVVDNVAKLFGFSRYGLNRIQREGLFSAVTEQIQPALPSLDNISKDIMALFKDFEESFNVNKLRSIQEIPVVGRLYYWWFGKGAELKKRFDDKEGRQIKTREVKTREIKPREIKKRKLKSSSLFNNTNALANLVKSALTQLPSKERNPEKIAAAIIKKSVGTRM